ncbi:MAG: hypothetical protein D6753_17650, partial [Planctomycetota bacterium]
TAEVDWESFGMPIRLSRLVRPNASFFATEIDCGRSAFGEDCLEFKLGGAGEFRWPNLPPVVRIACPPSASTQCRFTSVQ